MAHHDSTGRGNRFSRRQFGQIALAAFGAKARLQAAEPAPTYRQTLAGITPQTELDIVGGDVTAVRALNSIGEQIGETRIDSSRAPYRTVADLFPEQSDVTSLLLESTQPFKAQAIDVKREETGRLFGAYLMPGNEFGSQSITLLPESPANVFYKEKPKWQSSAVVMNTGDSAELVIGQSTKGIARNETQRIPLEEIVKGKTAALRVRNFDASAGTPAAYQEFANDKSRFALSLPIEQAAREHYVTHILMPTPGEESFFGWQEAIGIVPASEKDGVAYITSFNDLGQELPQVAVAVPAGAPYVAKVQDLLAVVPGGQKAQWLRINTSEPSHVFSAYKNEEHITAVPAATSLDLGGKLRAHGARVQGVTSSYALLNPGASAEVVEAVAVDDKKQELAKATFTIQPRRNTAHVITGLFKEEQLANVKYVDFKTASGRPITGMSLDFGAYLAGGIIDNMEPIRMLLELDTYNPRTRETIAEENDGPATLNITVIGADRNILGVAYDPLGKGVTRGFSASVTAKNPSRRLYALQKTFSGPVAGEFDTNNISATTLVTPKILITTHDGVQQSTYERQSRLLATGEIFHEIDETKGAGYTYRMIKADPEGIARILTDHAPVFTNPDYQRSFDNWKRLFTLGTTEGNPWNIMWFDIMDRPTANFALIKFTQGTVYAIYSANTPAGERFMDDTKNFFQVGYKWNHKPKPGEILLVPK